MPASRSVVSVLLRELGDFLYPSQGRPCGRPPAAAVLAPATTRRSPGEQPHPASKLLESHQGVARHPYRRMLGALTERGISSIPAAHPGGVRSMRKAATFVGLALDL
jgi:hypothetical protein